MSRKEKNPNFNDPLVSVIMPVYNRADTIRRAVDSVLNQDWENIELIVVDDGSNDGSVKILESYGDSIKLIIQKNEGAYFARNHGLKYVNGEFIAFIDSDDFWLPHRISSQIPLFDRSRIGLVFGNARIERQANEGNGKMQNNYFDLFPPFRGKVTKKLCYQNFVPQSSVIIRRECYTRFAGFFTGNKRASDYVKWFELSLHFEFDYVSNPVFVYSLHDSNLSGSIEGLLHPPVEGFYEIINNNKLDAETRKHIHLVIFRFKIWCGILLIGKLLQRLGVAIKEAHSNELGLFNGISCLYKQIVSTGIKRN